jgi:hypothetical protein
MLLKVQPHWWDDARRVAALPFYRQLSPTQVARLELGLVAERAVIAHLLRLSDDAVTWLSAQPNRPNYAVPWERRAHRGDVIWRGQELDVKLLSRRSDTLLIKVGAEHLHHVFITWYAVPSLLVVRGVLVPHQPETFEPPVPLVHPRSKEPLHHLRDATRPVCGWVIPDSRLQPLTDLLEQT